MFMANDTENVAGKLTRKSTTPKRARSAPPQKHVLDQTAARRIYRGLHTVSLTNLTRTWRKKSSYFYRHPIEDPAKAKRDWKKREAFNEWREFHFAYDHPEEGREGGTIEEFLDKYVPSPVNMSSQPAMRQELVVIAEEVRTVSSEADTYPYIISLLNQCQEGLKDGKKINFIDASNFKITNPIENDDFTGADILGSYPGQPAVTTDHTFDKYCIAIEVELHSDPVAEAASTVPAFNYTIETIAKISNIGKNLLFTSSACYVFVIGIYPRTQQMRIYRFDHSGSVSCGFNYLQKPHLVREFIWRFVNPHHGIPHTVVGWDETMQVPTDEEIEKMKEIIKPWYSWLEIDKKDCRWLRVRVNRASFPSEINDGLPYYDLKGMTFGPPLYKSPRLFSSVAYVSRILVEIPGHGFHVLVVKDSWRPLLHKPESVYYDKIQQRFPLLKELDSFQWVKDMYPEIDAKPNWIPGLAEYYGSLDLSSSELELSTASSDDRGHTTVTRRHFTGDEKSDRVRERILTGPVGGYIEDYSKTRDFVTAIRDAAVGHYIARCCGVLHRDVSAGNILVSREPSGEVRGFLHDFDHASFYECAAFPEDADEGELEERSRDLNLLAGTREFMAISLWNVEESHMPHHDIESFYWVMVWTLLQHEDHTHRTSLPYTNMFDHDDDFIAKTIKRCWITSDKEPMTMKNNPLLSQLLVNLRKMFSQYIWRKPIELRPTHEKFIRELDDSVKTEGWPDDDHSVDYCGPGRVEAFRLSSERPCLSSARKRRAAFDDEGQKNKKVRG